MDVRMAPNPFFAENLKCRIHKESFENMVLTSEIITEDGSFANSFIVISICFLASPSKLLVQAHNAITIKINTIIFLIYFFIKL